MANTSINKRSSPRIKDLKLNALLEVTKAINSNSPTDELLRRFEDILRNQLNIGRLVLFSNDRGWKCILKYGVGDEYNNVDFNELVKIKEISTIDFSSGSLNNSFEIVIPVFHKSMPLAYVLIGDLEDKMEVSPAIKHLPFVQTLTNIIVVAIENKKLAKENIRQEGVRKELELASQMQAMLFPRFLPNDDKLETAALYLPHQQVGGDYYDFIQINENEVAFCMADVSGKGVSAALLMSNFQANLRALFNHTTSLTELVKDLNQKVMSNANGEKFITLFIGKYNIVTRVLTYLNAGHNPPVMADGNSVSLLKVGCTGLGMFDELIKVKEGIVNITPGTVIVCYTDGVVEVENDKEEDFSIEQLTDMIRKNLDLGMKDLNELIIQKINEHKGELPYVDDIALFSCRML
jgi:sigma-B regulation protein RsbU (phosphoserine phosphatase)